MYFTSKELEQIINYKLNGVLPDFIKNKPKTTIYDFEKRAENWKIIPGSSKQLFNKEGLEFVAEEEVFNVIRSFYNTDLGFSTGKDALFHKLKSKNLCIHASSCLEFLNGLTAQQLHKTVKPTNQDRIFVPNRPLELIIADTTVMDSYRGFSIILNLIDSFSKKAWSVPIKNQTALGIKNGLIKIFSDMDKPSRIQFDQGSEF